MTLVFRRDKKNASDAHQAREADGVGNVSGLAIRRRVRKARLRGLRRAKQSALVCVQSTNTNGKTTQTLLYATRRGTGLVATEALRSTKSTAHLRCAPQGRRQQQIGKYVCVQPALRSVSAQDLRDP